MSMKNRLTPAGIEPATFRFVAQHLNHCATTVPLSTSTLLNLSVGYILRAYIKCGLYLIIMNGRESLNFYVAQQCGCGFFSSFAGYRFTG